MTPNDPHGAPAPGAPRLPLALTHDTPAETIAAALAPATTLTEAARVARELMAAAVALPPAPGLSAEFVRTSAAMAVAWEFATRVAEIHAAQDAARQGPVGPPV